MKINYENEPEKVKNATGKLFPFGSYKIGVMSPSSDIDCLCIAPKYASRKKYFFGAFYDVLSNHNHVSDIIKVEKARVPVMKLKF